MSTHSYSILNDTANGLLNVDALKSEIEASAVTIALDSISSAGDVLTISFKAMLDAQNLTDLDNVVAAHEGQTLEKPTSVVQLEQLTPEAKIPKVAIYEAEGDFNSVVSHNFSDNTTWPANDNSVFVLEPEFGKRMFLKKAEVQFTHDIQLNGVSELYFDVWVYNPLFDAGQTAEAELDTYNPFTDAPRNQLRFLFERKIYKSILDVLNIGNAHYTMSPVDGITHSLSTVQFNYPRAIPLLSSQGGQVRCSSKDNVELGGQFCTITFTTSSEDEA